MQPVREIRRCFDPTIHDIDIRFTCKLHTVSWWNIISNRFGMVSGSKVIRHIVHRFTTRGGD
ncbi:hypothetical protein HanOQP8_Chr13g0500991 [Helianthus annuus]|nr:hypothetical protein HanOQP8_Chr13g0500991 [Helianthus annuus]KAJ0851101.1 hypothetical protein HanPSC8_Chr13g0588431 [Helianthus annuus]